MPTGWYTTQPGMLSASPHHERQTLSVPPSLLWWDSTWENGVFLNSSKHLRRHRLLHNTLMSQNRWLAPPLPQGCHLSHQINHLQWAKHFIGRHWSILTSSQLLAALGTLVLARSFEKELYWLDTDECQQMAQYLNPRLDLYVRHQLQGSSQ